ncbi:MAG: hypothetical protein E7547_08715 [Ruminococcaceae bacterium]|nr:hypothetical protein [Oscillospiraceae bacterium]
MSNIIEELYYGNIEPQELNSELSSKLSKKLNALTEKEEQLTAKLTNENKELFLDYVNTYNKFLSLSNSDSFISGFRLGAKFIYDTFNESLKG